MKSCELLLVKVANCALGLTIAIIYRAPDTSVGDFATELSDMIHSGRLGTRNIICGDLNCPGPAGTKTDSWAGCFYMLSTFKIELFGNVDNSK